MCKRIYLLAFILASFLNLPAQQFISKAMIEYEVTANVKKTMGNNTFEEMLKESLPTFKTGYYNFTFANNKSVYKFDHWAPGPKMPDFLKRGDEDNIWYYDYNSSKYGMLKNIWGTNLNIEDSIPKLEWRITNENRIIAGFNCRKAVAKIFDSVYVFAFYTDEILIPGGPCSINGLPGMILGVTIPRLYTSWIATKVSVVGVDENAIKQAAVKKTYTMSFLKSTIEDRIKDWTPDNDEQLQQKNRFIWTLLL